MSFRNKTVAGTTASGLPKRNPQGSQPPNGVHGDDISHQRSTATPGPDLEAPGNVVDGPANGPDQINR
ncbi:hypothetical protein SEA_DRYAD_94 [Streptomyces phage Dryad]|nr:hypothetical protein SEA_DRYAD_94 [Streptomyces phage Dryad]